MCSVTMVLTNKALAMLPAWRSNELLLLPVIMQAASALVLLVGWELWSTLRSGVGLEAACCHVHTKLWPGYQRAIRCMPCATAFVIMILTSFLAFGGVSVPFATVGKNASNTVTAFGEWLLFGTKPGQRKIFALGLMFVGALASAWNDLTFELVPYTWLVVNCLATSIYVLSMRVLSVGGPGLPSKEASIAINNLLCITLLIPASFLRGELGHVQSAGISELFTPWAIALHALAGNCAFLLNFATMRCIALTGATTYSMVGAANKLPVAVLGFMIWQTPVSREGVVSIGIGLVSAVDRKSVV